MVISSISNVSRTYSSQSAGIKKDENNPSISQLIEARLKSFPAEYKPPGLNLLSLFSIQAKVESSYNPFAQSEKGAIGILQLMPGTAGQIADNILSKKSKLYAAIKESLSSDEEKMLQKISETKDDVVMRKLLSNKNINILLGMTYMLDLLGKTSDEDRQMSQWPIHEKLAVALAAYNRGFTGVIKDIEASNKKKTPWVTELPSESKEYVKKILSEDNLVSRIPQRAETQPKVREQAKQLNIQRVKMEDDDIPKKTTYPIEVNARYPTVHNAALWVKEHIPGMKNKGVQELIKKIGDQNGLGDSIKGFKIPPGTKKLNFKI